MNNIIKLNCSVLLLFKLQRMSYFIFNCFELWWTYHESWFVYYVVWVVYDISVVLVRFCSEESFNYVDRPRLFDLLKKWFHSLCRQVNIIVYFPWAVYCEGPPSFIWGRRWGGVSQKKGSTIIPVYNWHTHSKTCCNVLCCYQTAKASCAFILFLLSTNRCRWLLIISRAFPDLALFMNFVYYYLCRYCMILHNCYSFWLFSALNFKNRLLSMLFRDCRLNKSDKVLNEVHQNISIHIPLLI